MLDDIKYQEKIKQIIKDYQNKMEDNKNNIHILWDNLKIAIRDISTDYSKYKANLKRNEIKTLEKQLDILQTQMKNNISDKQQIEQILHETETKLETYYEEKLTGAKIRSRVKWVEEGEKSSKYFLGLEKSRQIQKAIMQIKDINNKITENQEEILQATRSYYQNLYTSTKPNKDNIKTYINETKTEFKLNDKDSNSCEGKITIQECKAAIFTMKINRSPGIDGLPVEFYRTFYNEIQDILLILFNNIYEKRKLTNSQKTGVISLVFKKNDPLDLNNYRPITLLNIDTKILAHILAQRVKNVLPKIIHSDQKGFVKNRYIGFNVRQIQDIIDYSENYQTDGAILFLDFSKAFDSIEWDFMFRSLKKFGFKKSFITWVTILYNGIQGCTQNNGWISQKFEIERGIRQGCPLSA